MTAETAASAAQDHTAPGPVDHDDVWVKNVEKVILTEKAIIAGGAPADGQKLFGLALSGGGIRSASFAMGVMQALNAADEKYSVLDRMHYLSTVSGGGYTGSSYTWFRRHFPEFPFGVRLEGIRSHGRTIGTQILSYIRQYGSYLFPTSELGLISAVAMVGWAIFWSLIIYGTVVVGLEMLLYGALPRVLDFDAITSAIIHYLHIPLRKAHEVGDGTYYMRWSPWPYALLAALCLVWVFMLGLWFVRKTFSADSYSGRLNFQTRSGKALAWVVIFLSLASVPFLHFLLQQADDQIGKNMPDILKALGMPATSGVFGIVVGVAVAIYRFLKEMKSDVGQPPARREWLVIAGTILLTFGMLVTGYDIAHGLLKQSTWYLTLAVGFVVAFVGYGGGRFVNINRVSIHALYRDRLMEVFLSPFTNPRKSDRDPKWRPATLANSTPLSQMCGMEQGKAKVHPPAESTPQERVAPHTPYHIVNTNIVLGASQRKEFRGRGGDNFILSPLYCGSDATGYQLTHTYMADQLTLASAMAISGAAVNPNCGVGGRGITRNTWVSILLGVLNIRLGIWLLRPRSKKIEEEKQDFWCWFEKNTRFGLGKEHPDFMFPGVGGILNGGGTETAAYVELSDGGHFENTGLYELVRRELDVIILSDAGADPAFAFGDLGNAIERVRVDFGAVVRFEPAWDLTGVIPGSGGNKTLVDKFDIASRGFAIGAIEYPTHKPGQPGKTGVFIYLKPTMTADLPADVFAYRAVSPEFPHQPTSDQFFDENQLEAYRELGYQSATKMWTAVRTLTTLGTTAGAAKLDAGAFEALKALQQTAP